MAGSAVVAKLLRKPSLLTAGGRLVATLTRMTRCLKVVFRCFSMWIVAGDTCHRLALLIAPTFLQVADLVCYTILFGQFHFEDSKIIIEYLTWTVTEWRLSKVNRICMALCANIHEPLTTELPRLYDVRRDLF